VSHRARSGSGVAEAAAVVILEVVAVVPAVVERVVVVLVVRAPPHRAVAAPVIPARAVADRGLRGVREGAPLVVLGRALDAQAGLGEVLAADPARALRARRRGHVGAVAQREEP